ncbi:MAG: spore germination protein GerW family protein [Anaerolineales bacterium]|jgi:uncharacterized spore protein YtfJ
MSEEKTPNDNEEELEKLDYDRPLDIYQDNVDTFLEVADVSRTYGDPIQSGDNLIIPTAEVLAGMGFGVGAGFGRSNKEDESQGGGSGGGGGGRVLSRPVAVVIASPEGVRVEPVLDVTKIALAALTAGGFMLATLARMSRRNLSLED